MRTEGRRSIPLSFAASVALTAAGCNGAKDAAVPESEPTARVEVAIARPDTLIELVRAYGVVIPAPGSVQSFSVPFEAIVDRLLVNTGQRVRQGDELLRLSESSDVRLAAEQARAALESQQTVTEDTRRRFDLGLATLDDRAQQEQALSDARSQVDKYATWAKRTRLVAPASGLVGALPVSEGQVVPAGSPLISLALHERFEVRLDVESEDLALLHEGQPVLLTPMDRSARAPLPGRIRNIGQQVNPDTRLVEILVAPPDGTDQLLLNQFVRGEIEVRGTDGFVVPRSAVLPHEDRFSVFTVHEGRVTRHSVVVGVESDRFVQIRGEGLAAGDSVVVLGNYELADSMRVEVTGVVGETP
ncbi:MAG: efflux RND transporter periplasmic adaptor subunit [bacterium]